MHGKRVVKDIKTLNKAKALFKNANRAEDLLDMWNSGRIMANNYNVVGIKTITCGDFIYWAAGAGNKNKIVLSEFAQKAKDLINQQYDYYNVLNAQPLPHPFDGENIPYFLEY